MGGFFSRMGIPESSTVRQPLLANPNRSNRNQPRNITPTVGVHNNRRPYNKLQFPATDTAGPAIATAGPPRSYWWSPKSYGSSGKS